MKFLITESRCSKKYFHHENLVYTSKIYRHKWFGCALLFNPIGETVMESSTNRDINHPHLIRLKILKSTTEYSVNHFLRRF